MQKLAGEKEVIVGLALDHRDSFRAAVRKRTGLDLNLGQLRELKRQIAGALADHATTILLDEEMGSPALGSGAVPSRTALLMPLENQGYESTDDDLVTTLMGDFGPVQALRWGADGCKLLVPYRADRPAAASRQEQTIRTAVAACHDQGLPLLLEPVVRQRQDESPETFRQVLPDLLVESVRRVAGLGVDVLKLQFPLPDGQPMTLADEDEARQACLRLDSATGGIPWVLLGGETSPSEFEARLTVACTSGASGFLSGRALWGDALTDQPQESGELARKICLPTLKRWAAIASTTAVPLKSRVEVAFGS